MLSTSASGWLVGLEILSMQNRHSASNFVEESAHYQKTSKERKIDSIDLIIILLLSTILTFSFLISRVPVRTVGTVLLLKRLSSIDSLDWLPLHSFTPAATHLLCSLVSRNNSHEHCFLAYQTRAENWQSKWKTWLNGWKTNNRSFALILHCCDSFVALQ